MPETSIRVAQALGITVSSFLSGAILSISFISIPSILLAPGLLAARQWHKLFLRGKAAAPPLAMISSLAFAYLSYKMSKTLNQTKGELYGLAAFSTLSIIPYTLLMMKGVNDKLTSKADNTKAMSLDKIVAEEDKGDESAKELIDWWATLNLGRGLLPLLGATVGAWATMA